MYWLSGCTRGGAVVFHAETRHSHVRDLRMAPHDPRCLYAGIEVGGVVRSRDGGASWQQLPGTHDDIHCISLSTARPQTVYVATARGPYRSADEGQHWELINHGLQRPYALHISAALDDADLVLVTVSTNARRQQPQLYRSTRRRCGAHHLDGIRGRYGGSHRLGSQRPAACLRWNR